MLSNSSNSPLYLLCFTAGNEKGASIAIKIANHLLAADIAPGVARELA